MISSIKKQYTDTKTNYVGSYGTTDFEAIFDTQMGETINGTVSVTAPVTTKYHTVTKYRDETQYKTETRYRTETRCD